MVTDLENYLFDLRGYLHLEGALTADEVKDSQRLPRRHPTARAGRVVWPCPRPYLWHG